MIISGRVIPFSRQRLISSFLQTCCPLCADFCCLLLGWSYCHDRLLVSGMEFKQVASVAVAPLLVKLLLSLLLESIASLFVARRDCQ